MREFIDKTRLMQRIHTGMTLIEAMQEIINAPAADVSEVRHGRWVDEPGHIPHCSECGRYSDDADTGEAICCPFCGAKMAGGQDNG